MPSLAELLDTSAQWGRGVQNKISDLVSPEAWAQGLRNPPRVLSQYQQMQPGQQQQTISEAFDNALNFGPAMLGKIVYHGSPHKFDAFDALKIGTGEGAQAYGHGLYFAESKNVADEYAGKLSKPFVQFASGLPENIYEKAILEKLNSIAGTTQLEARGTSVSSRFNEFMNPRMWKYDPKNPKANSYNGTVPLEGKELETAMAYKKAAERLGSPTVYDTGSLYKVDLPDEHIAKMLDWDKPLSQQNWYRPVADVVKEYKGAGKDVDAYAKLISKANARGGKVTGGQFYEGMLSQFGGNQAKVSEFMREAGIPGIRYLDQGSRTAGEGTSNYVVFPGNEKLTKILERN